MQGKKKAKRTWASAKRIKIRTVGDCLYCTKEITNDMSFIIFATKQPAHHSCYKTQTEKEQKCQAQVENIFHIQKQERKLLKGMLKKQEKKLPIKKGTPNPVAKDLRSPQYKAQIIPSKKVYNRKKITKIINKV